MIARKPKRVTEPKIDTVIRHLANAAADARIGRFRVELRYRIAHALIGALAVQERLRARKGVK